LPFILIIFDLALQI